MTLRRVWVIAGAIVLATSALGAQDAQSELDARARELAERLRVSLEQQSKLLSRMQRDLEQAARADSRTRDSLMRSASSRIRELSAAIGRIQFEADSGRSMASRYEVRTRLDGQLSSARALANVTRALAGQQRALMFSTLSANAQPRGYLGVTLSGTQITEVRDGKVFTLFRSPSLIESVEAGSPAALAGLEAGDTLTAFGRLSLPGAVPLAELLRPNERLLIRIRRDGKERTQSVLVGTRPASNYASSVIVGDGDRGSVHCDGANCTVTVNVGVSSPRPPSAVAGPLTPRSPSGVSAPTPTSPPSVPGFSFRPVFPFSSTDLSVAGATMTTITDELEELTGVSEGILVLRVAPGTPAATSGLRGGDVILKVNDDEVSGVRDLQIAVQRESTRGGKQVALTVSRQRKERTITLQW
jgi:C-terminal processing protease CtpA/Prc